MEQVVESGRKGENRKKRAHRHKFKYGRIHLPNLGKRKGHETISPDMITIILLVRLEKHRNQFSVRPTKQQLSKGNFKSPKVGLCCSGSYR